MGKFIDLTGRIFGNLTVIRRFHENKGRKIVWVCKCVCGNVCNIVGDYLRCGDTTSCGCYHALELAMRIGTWQEKNIIGKKFGKLLVIEKDYNKSKSHYSKFLCVCECGTFVSVGKYSLLKGITQSCGCLRKEITSKIHSKKHIEIPRGTIFSKLTIIERFIECKKDAVRYKCLCECGNFTISTAGSLKNGNKKSCGCLKKSKK